MPALNYRLRWPDQSESVCYSPSSTIRDFFEAGASYALPEFLQRVRAATQLASDRVEAKYGYACAAAADQLVVIEGRAALFAGQPEARVQLVSFAAGD